MAIIGIGCLAYYKYKKLSSRTVYFIRIGRQPFLNKGETGRFMYRCAARGAHTAYSLAEGALTGYSGWDDVKTQMKVASGFF
ncbi:MAG: hypothetical protein ABGY72_10260 [bacterium]